MSRFVRSIFVAALVSGLALVAVPGAARAADKPTAVVAMGDSFISGEAAGSYLPGTDQPGNFCHRSAVSEIARTTIPGISARVNLACSGARTTNVALGGSPQNGEAPQAERLRAVAANYDVKLVVLTIGANNVGFADMVLDCVKAYFLLADRCQDVWATKLGTKLAAAQPLIAQNIADIRTVMAEAGYSPDSYQLVLQSYSSPATGTMRYGLTKAFEGCPIRNDDGTWATNSAVPQFTAAMSQVAAQTGVRFLDLGPALRGREVCATGISHSQEWVRGITIDVGQILNGLGKNIVQQSMHPNASGHAQFGRCLTSFYAAGGNARCVRQADGNLAPVPVTLSSLTRLRPTLTTPYIPEPAPPK